MTFEAFEITNEEQVRQNIESQKPCSVCKEKMTVGEEEAGEMCSKCYFKIHDDEEHGFYGK